MQHAAFVAPAALRPPARALRGAAPRRPRARVAAPPRACAPPRGAPPPPPPADDEDGGTFVLDAPDDAADAPTFVLDEEEAHALAPGVGCAVRERPFGAGDVALLGVITAVVYALATTTARLYGGGGGLAAVEVETALAVLPGYAVQSLTRLFGGFVVSLVFSLGYAYVAYRVRFAAAALMLAIDVLQSIPLLSFLPGVVLGLIALFPPGARIGVELAAVLLLFTSMAWNMLLGFYQSLCGLPSDLQDVSTAFGLTPWKRFWVLELPAGAIGLVWNAIISVAGGWFFLISIESFELGARDFRLPGLGSYLAAAASAGDYRAILAALSVIVAIIVALDFCVWRPLITWSAKFKHGAAPADAPKSFVFNALSRSVVARAVGARFLKPAWEAFVSLDLPRRPSASARPPPRGALRRRVARPAARVARALAPALPRVGIAAFGAVVLYASVCAGVVVRALTRAEWAALGTGAVLTLGRVCAALALSLLWTVPVGIAIGRSPKLAERLQPVVQIAASVPATALFPFVLLFLAKLGGGLQVGSVALMTLGTMWYVLVNVIAGTQAIPSELFEVDAIYNPKGSWVRRWRTVILPGVFPYLITGVVTAVGGAWNASIVSEYVVFRGGVLQTPGLGSLISQAAASGNYPLLLGGTLVMSVLVLLTNRFVWGPLYRLAETKYKI